MGTRINVFERNVYPLSTQVPARSCEKPSVIPFFRTRTFLAGWKNLGGRSAARIVHSRVDASFFLSTVCSSAREERIQELIYAR